jgi:hypothetical protein
MAFRALGARIEIHGCASPEVMRDYISTFGGGRLLFPNGDGTDKYAKGINDGRPGYTEPSYEQAVEMGKIMKKKGLFGYIFKGRKFRRSQDLRKADFIAVKGLARGVKSL